MRSLALFAVLAFAMASAGCAMIGAQAPDPDRPRDRPPICNDGKGGVVVDGLMATALGVATLGLASNDEGGSAAITGVGALIYGISAGVGSSSAKKCREANEEYAQLRERESVEAAFMHQGGGSANAPGEIAPEDEDSPMASIPPPKPRPVVAPPPLVATPPPTSAQPPPSRPEPKTRPAADEIDWSEFWKEVP
jgi:hypothetical protein